jgi:hypothetical protein
MFSSLLQIVRYPVSYSALLLLCSGKASGSIITSKKKKRMAGFFSLVAENCGAYVVWVSNSILCFAQARGMRFNHHIKKRMAVRKESIGCHVRLQSNKDGAYIFLLQLARRKTTLSEINMITIHRSVTISSHFLVQKVDRLSCNEQMLHAPFGYC